MPLSKRRRVIALVFLASLLFPVPVTCGTAALGYTCMPAPDPSGYVSVYFEVEPLAIALLEGITGTNIPVYYYAGYRHRRP